MRKNCIVLFFLLITASAFAEKPKKNGSKKNPKALEEIVITPYNPITAYKSSYKKQFDLIHTKLSIKPVFKEKDIYGTAELTLVAHFYQQSKLILDAKWMQIKNVELVSPVNKKLAFTYDTSKLTIDLGKTFSARDTFKISIDYVAQPYLQDSLQVQAGRGIYFIDVEDKNPYKPMHLWTQGEEESSSCWFPTIDATNQKTTEEIYITLDKNLTSLSNGLLIESKDNGDGTKTDYWKQDKPHSPYLFFVGIGDYFKWQTKWRNKEVSAYTFPKYKDAVGEIFKNMPEMIEFYSQTLGVDFPWEKMANIMAYDYTAGAMENTSAIIYYEKLLCNKQQLIDGNFDWIITHELFHQWFGDLVTAESWANLTLNESMADYSEYLWTDYKYGKEEADAYGDVSFEKYIKFAKTKNEPIINYYFDNPHNIFDEIRYEKGGRVLHMLRNYVGDDAFFKSLQKYLSDNKFNSAELSDLRKAFESVTGEDLNWFFNQWWIEKGHPVLDITHKYDEKNKTVELTIRQTQPQNEAPVFKIPTKIALYINGKKEIKNIEITDRVQSFYFAASSAPQLVDFDDDKVLLCEKTEDLSTPENIFKYQHSSLYKARLEALEALLNKQKDTTVQGVLVRALADKNWRIKTKCINNIEYDKFTNKDNLLTTLKNTLNTDTKSQVRESALQKIASIEKEKSSILLESILQKDSSFLVLSKALTLLNKYNKSRAYYYAQKLSTTESPLLMTTIGAIFGDTSANNLAFFKKAIWLDSPKNYKDNFENLEVYLQKTDAAELEKGVLFLKEINQYEESTYNIKAAKKTTEYLKDYFEDKAKKEPKYTPQLNILLKQNYSSWK